MSALRFAFSVRRPESVMKSLVSRRSFLTQTVWSILAFRATASAAVRLRTRSLIDDGTAAALPNQLLSLVNEERAAAGVSSLKLDELACNVAQKHAIEMAESGFLSHWSRDGLKPYHRYSFAGGTEAMEENEGAANLGGPVPAEEIPSEIIGLHKTMYDEHPPNDGHRKTILAPQNTHVGFGIACRANHVRLSEIYLARYAAIDPHPSVVKPRSTFMFGGRVLDPAYSVRSVDVFYETLPGKRELPPLLSPQPYGLPDDRKTLQLKLPDGTFYDDGSRGSIELHGGGKFRVPIFAEKKAAGIYTILVWIQNRQVGDPFPVTQVCVRAE